MADIFYRYYKLYPSHEHYLFAKELCEKIGLYSRKNKPHTKFFCDLYDSLTPMDEDKLYYHTHNGMVRAFSNWNTIFKIIDDISKLVEKDNDLFSAEKSSTGKDRQEYRYTVGDTEYLVYVDIHKIRVAAFLLRKTKEEIQDGNNV